MAYDSSVFGREIKTKQFHMATPETAGPKYSQASINFVDQESKPVGGIRKCTYNVNNVAELISELKKAYKEVIMDESNEETLSIQCKLNAGETIDESFLKVRAYKK